ncbi:hypothetical protein A9Z60_03970 [Moraxella nonliquefaciens]|uniref:Uncharacterized protein n=1 Tax=Moraxella nonliquefaciens TaxID=478 RepID=A0A1B8PI52_MORNO|nr:hypothetical protein A9Z60_03970 [Moraxella nonliquefaciens]OBX50415.1 hypothetical protein A9Z65_07045 [Moraxella nonliquefaciens]
MLTDGYGYWLLLCQSAKFFKTKTNEKIRLFYHDLPHLTVKNCNTDIDCLILKKSHLILKILKLINHGHFVIFLLGQYARYDI